MNVAYDHPCDRQYADALKPLAEAAEIRMNHTNESNR
jgi:hypothetical protein